MIGGCSIGVSHFRLNFKTSQLKLPNYGEWIFYHQFLLLFYVLFAGILKWPKANWKCIQQENNCKLAFLGV